MKSSWCNSSPVKAVAGRPAASVAIRRVTGGCEAYTVSKQVAMIQPRNRSNCDVDAVLSAEGSIRHTGMRGVVGIAGVASTGHACKGTFREPRRAPCFSAIWAPGGAQPKDTWSPGGEGCLREKRTPSSGVSCGQGKPEAQARAGEQSYDSIVPVKVENRRAPEKGRPRYPLEGRDEQVDVSTQCYMHETSNSGRHVKWS
jgi:hypothetical protein